MVDILEVYKNFRKHSTLDKSNFAINIIQKDDIFWESSKVTFNRPLSEYSKEELEELEYANKMLSLNEKYTRLKYDL